MLSVAKNNRLNPPLPSPPPKKRVLHPSSLSMVSRCCRVPQPNTWDRNLQSWQTVVLPSWSTGPLAQNTTCMFRMGDGRMTFTVMLQLEGFAFPHLLGAFSLQISFLLRPPPAPHALSTCSSSTSAPTRKARFMVLQVKWQGSQEESRTSSHSSKAAKIVYRNCTGSRIKRGK